MKTPAHVYNIELHVFAVYLQVEPGQFNPENCADSDTLETVACVIKTVSNSTEIMEKKCLYPKITDFGDWVRSKETEIKALV